MISNKEWTVAISQNERIETLNFLDAEIHAYYL